MHWSEYKKVGSLFNWMGSSFWYDVFLPGDMELSEDSKTEMLRNYYPQRFWALHGNGD
ncbi:hypothetical protein LCGC14_3149860 [marine sediment metagenome]|uniref:Uncharacterized protein n=1 Tax=marine sediment metagenome TaxID=412755 RepID=A0A0F8VUI5_9ZZZZ